MKILAILATLSLTVFTFNTHANTVTKNKSATIKATKKRNIAQHRDLDKRIDLKQVVQAVNERGALHFKAIEKANHHGIKGYRCDTVNEGNFHSLQYSTDKDTNEGVVRFAGTAFCYSNSSPYTLDIEFEGEISINSYNSKNTPKYDLKKISIEYKNGSSGA